MIKIQEEFKVIEEFGGDYLISNMGRVYSKPRLALNGYRNIVGRFLKLRLDAKGYPIVGVNHGGKYFIRPIHRLVALAFIDNPENKPQVNHIDGVKENNNVANLEWVTHSENMEHAWGTGLRDNCKGSDSRCVSSKILTPTDVKWLRLKNKRSKLNYTKWALIYGCNQQAMSLAVRGITWSHLPMH